MPASPHLIVVTHHWPRQVCCGDPCQALCDLNLLLSPTSSPVSPVFFPLPPSCNTDTLRPSVPNPEPFSLRFLLSGRPFAQRTLPHSLGLTSAMPFSGRFPFPSKEVLHLPHGSLPPLSGSPFLSLSLPCFIYHCNPVPSTLQTLPKCGLTEWIAWRRLIIQRWGGRNCSLLLKMTLIQQRGLRGRQIGDIYSSLWSSAVGQGPPLTGVGNRGSTLLKGSLLWRWDWLRSLFETCSHH